MNIEGDHRSSDLFAVVRLTVVQSDLEIPGSLWEQIPDEGSAEDGSASSGIAAGCRENGWRSILLAKPAGFVGISWLCVSLLWIGQ